MPATPLTDDQLERFACLPAHTMKPIKTNPQTASCLPRRTARQAESGACEAVKLPGLVAISFYMILLAAILHRAHRQSPFQPLYLIFPVLFIAGALGLLLLLRWAWALTLAAVALLAGLFLWTYTTQHNSSSVVQGLLNLVIFLYLVRTDVREKLR